MFKQISIFTRNKCGATIVEFAVILPLFFMLTIGVIAWGLALWQINALQYAAERAARCDILDNMGYSTSKKCVGYNSASGLNVDWIPGIVTNSFVSINTTNSTYSKRSFTSTALNKTVSYEASCISVQTDNNYIPGYSWLPNFLKQSYCRPRQ